jgi:hypothetical protein
MKSSIQLHGALICLLLVPLAGICHDNVSDMFCCGCHLMVLVEQGGLHRGHLLRGDTMPGSVIQMRDNNIPSTWARCLVHVRNIEMVSVFMAIQPSGDHYVPSQQSYTTSVEHHSSRCQTSCPSGSSLARYTAILSPVMMRWCCIL